MPDPDLQKRGGGVIQTLRKGECSIKNKNFLALRASVWSKNKEGGPGSPCPTPESATVNCNLFDSLLSNFDRNSNNRYPLFNNFDNNEKPSSYLTKLCQSSYLQTGAAYMHSCMGYRQKLVLVLKAFTLI